MNVGSVAVVRDARRAVKLAAGVDGEGREGRHAGGAEEGGKDKELQSKQAC